MKILTLGLLAIIALSQAASAEERNNRSRDEETKQVQMWEDRLSASISMTPTEKLDYLWPGLRNMGWRRTFKDHDPSVDAIYYRIQQAMLAVPEHAQYFADEIAREQKAVEKFPTCSGPRNSYDQQRDWYFKTLCHLPSPETIAVLGHFLYDDMDTPVPLWSPGSDWGENPRANSYFSSSTIIDIGLRKPPVERQPGIDNPVLNLAKTRAWWEKIKSGKLTFSFIGQSVEYRFKPDGTWDSIAMTNPPTPRKPEPSGNPSMPGGSTQNAPASGNGTGSSVGDGPLWKWLFVGIAIVIGGGVALLRILVGRRNKLRQESCRIERQP